MVDTRFFESVGDVKLSDLLREISIDASHLSLDQLAVVINNAAPLETANANQISLAASKKYASLLETTNCGVVFIVEQLAEYVPKQTVAIHCKDPHLAFVKALDFLFPKTGHHLSHCPKVSHLGEPQLEKNVLIGQNAVIGDGVQIGEGSTIGPNSVIAAGVTIGRNVIISDNVTIECALIGDNVVIDSGVRIGTKGFGWLDFGKSNHQIPQLGRVIVQSGADIGANTNIDRGALGDTIIGENTKIGALVEIGHNCILGRNCLIAPMCGLAGGAILGDGVLMGASSACVGHITIGAGSIIHARSSASKSWPAGSMLGGAPAQDIKDYWRELAAFKKLAKGMKK